jgi:hypothetical protein
MAGKKVLLALDDARNHAQVEHLLPPGEQVAPISGLALALTFRRSRSARSVRSATYVRGRSPHLTDPTGQRRERIRKGPLPPICVD